MAPPKRPLTPEEQRLWGLVTGDVEPLPDDKRKPPARKPKAKPKTAAPAPKQKAEKPKRPVAAAPKPAPQPQPAQPGKTPGLDRRNAQRLRRGQMKIDARLDLHGMTQAEAHGSLNRFLADSAAAGRRCVLVITGKGSRPRDDDLPIPARTGVLRDAVPRWLAEPGNRALIVATHTAAAQHGGGGALYVLLRRKRS